MLDAHLAKPTSIRTTLTLDNDIFIQARSIARAEKRSMGDVVSAWARQALTGTPTPATARQSMSDEDAQLKARLAELGIFPIPKPRGVVVTNEEINRIREELGIEVSCAPYSMSTCCRPSTMRAHSFRKTAQSWATSERNRHGIATCAITQNGCLRIASQRRYSNPISLEEAFKVLRSTTENPNHQFWDSDLSLLAPEVLKPGYLLGHRQLTDVYLLAVAVKHGGCLRSFDDNIPIEAVLGAKPKHLVLL